MIPTVHTLDPAYKVIERLGGKSAVSERLGLNKSTLTRWCRPAPDGTGGVIPQRYWPALMEMARERHVRLGLKELAAVEV